MEFSRERDMPCFEYFVTAVLLATSSIALADELDGFDKRCNCYGVANFGCQECGLRVAYALIDLAPNWHHR
jgi:hypothetical protein